MEVKIENNQIKINIQDLFYDLSEEEMEELAEHYLWHSTLYKSLVRNLKDNLASKNYNEEYYQLLKSFFTFDGDIESDWDKESFEDRIFYSMRYNVKSILEENAMLYAENYKLQNAEYSLYNKILESFGYEFAYQFHNAFVSEVHAKPYNYELASDMAEKVPYKKMVDEWANVMMRKFNPEK